MNFTKEWTLSKINVCEKILLSLFCMANLLRKNISKVLCPPLKHLLLIFYYLNVTTSVPKLFTYTHVSFMTILTKLLRLLRTGDGS